MGIGVFVIVGASLLGTASCLLIAWSLWSRTRPRPPRARPTGGHPPVAQAGQDYGDGYGDDAEPSTQFLSEAELFGAGGPPPQDKPRRTQFMSSSASGAAPTQEQPAPGMRTEFLSSEDLFPEAEPATQFLSSEELFGEQEDDDDDDDDGQEVATQFLSSEELFGAHGGVAGSALAKPSGGPPTRQPMRTEETVVLAPGAQLEDSGSGHVPPQQQHLDRPPVHRIPLAPPSHVVGPPLVSPAPAPASQPRGWTPQPQPQPQPRPPAPAPAPQVATPQRVPPSRLPAGVATAPPRAAVRPAPARPVATPDVPQPSVPHSSQGYVGFVGAPLDDDDDDDDDDFDEDDPETEMVHQAELLRLMTQLKSKPPGSQ
jgi:hypothetical protein